MGAVIVSLDVELGWGHKWTNTSYVDQIRRNSLSIESNIRALVDLFSQFDIKATWAVVGKLVEEGDDPVFHFPKLMDILLESDVDHDIGLHSYSHIPFVGLSQIEAKRDLQSGLSALSEYGVSPESFIYPQNKIKHLEVLAENGFSCFRDRADSTFLGGRLPVIIPPNVELSRHRRDLVRIPGSLFIADLKKPVSMLKWQAVIGILKAIWSGGCIHFWLHPHNTLIKPENLELLSNVFKFINRMENQGRLEVLTMSEAANTICY